MLAFSIINANINLSRQMDHPERKRTAGGNMLGGHANFMIWGLVKHTNVHSCSQQLNVLIIEYSKINLDYTIIHVYSV